jgi:hypothetical protein
MIFIPSRGKRPRSTAQYASFEVMDGNRRVPCTMATNFASQEQPTLYFRSNRPLLEEVATVTWSTWP